MEASFKKVFPSPITQLGLVVGRSIIYHSLGGAVANHLMSLPVTKVEFGT